MSGVLVEKSSIQETRTNFACGPLSRGSTLVTVLNILLDFFAKLGICVLVFGRHVEFRSVGEWTGLEFELV